MIEAFLRSSLLESDEKTAKQGESVRALLLLSW